MHEDLEPIATLKFTSVAEAAAKEMQANLGKALAGRGGGVQSGYVENLKLKVRLDAAERRCRALAEIWTDLIRRKYGHLSRQDKDFIIEKVQQCTAASSHVAGQFMASPGLSWPAGFETALAQQASMRMSSVAASINRELEIMVREHELFPHEKVVTKGEDKIQINISGGNIANLNLGSQLGNINAALQTIASSDNAESQKVAEALKELTEATVASAQLSDVNKREIVEALTDLSRQAAMPTSERSTGTLKALFTWLPTALQVAADATAVWDKWGEQIKTFFGL